MDAPLDFAAAAPAAAPPPPAPVEGPASFVFVPISINPESQGVHTGHAVVIVLAINAVLTVLGYVVWRLCASGLQLYHPVAATAPPGMSFYFRTYQQVGADAPREQLAGGSHGLLAQLEAQLFSAAPFVHIAQRAGRDVAVYLAFLKMMIVVALFATFMALAVFFPLHFFAPGAVEGSLSADENFVRGTVSSVRDRPGLLVIHVCGHYALAAVVIASLYRFVGVVREICAHGCNRSAAHRLCRRTVRLKGLGWDVGPGAASRLRSFFSEKFPGKVVAVHVAYDVRKRLKLQQQLRSCLLRLKYLSDTDGAAAARSAARLRRRRGELEQAASDWVDGLLTDPGSLRCAGFAHVVMRDEHSARRALRLRSGCARGDRFSIHVAHHPKDICWQNVGQQATARRFLVRAVLVVGLIFLSTPSAILSAFQAAVREVPGARDLNSGLTSISESRGGAVVFQYLPVLAFLIISLVLPCVIDWISRAEPHTSHFKFRQIVQRRFYVYLVLCTFVLPSIALSTVSAFIYAFSSDTSHNRDVLHSLVSHSLGHMFLPDSGAFFVNYVQVLGTLGNLYELWRPYELLLFLRQSVFQTVDLKDRWTQVDEFEFAWQYPVALVVFTICFNFTIFIPVVTIFFLFFFVARFVVHCHHTQTLMYCNRDALDELQMGRGVKSLCSLVHLSMLVSQFFVCCFFLFKVTDIAYIPHAVCSLILFAVIAAHYAAWGRVPSAAYATVVPDGDPFTTGFGGRWCGPGLVRTGSEQLLRPHSDADEDMREQPDALANLYATPFIEHLPHFSASAVAVAGSCVSGGSVELVEDVAAGAAGSDDGGSDGRGTPEACGVNLSLDSELFDSDASSLRSDS